MRVDGWQRALNEYLISAQSRYRDVGFIPGEFDCVHFVADWIVILTGDDPLLDYRGAYRTEEEGFALLADREGSVEQALRNRFGEPIHPAMGHRGDIAYVKIGDIEACGILFSAGSTMRAVFLGNGGFAPHRVRDVHQVFAVR